MELLLLLFMVSLFLILLLLSIKYNKYYIITTTGLVYSLISDDAFLCFLCASCTSCANFLYVSNAYFAFFLLYSSAFFTNVFLLNLVSVTNLYIFGAFYLFFPSFVVHVLLIIFFYIIATPSYFLNPNNLLNFVNLFGPNLLGTF